MQVLLPLDALKIKRQVNPEAFRGRGVVRIFLEEGTTLYRGWGWTMARNAPGSFAVCIVNALAISSLNMINSCSSLVLRQRRRTSWVSQTITGRHGLKISSLLSQALLLLSPSLRRSILSKHAYRMRTSRRVCTVWLYLKIL